jgi:hypothetical protein
MPPRIALLLSFFPSDGLEMNSFRTLLADQSLRRLATHMANAPCLLGRGRGPLNGVHFRLLSLPTARVACASDRTASSEIHYIAERYNAKLLIRRWRKDNSLKIEARRAASSAAAVEASKPPGNCHIYCKHGPPSLIWDLLSGVHGRLLSLQETDGHAWSDRVMSYR